MLPLRQKTEFGTLKEVVLGRTDKSAFPHKCKANAGFTDYIEDLGAGTVGAMVVGGEKFRRIFVWEKPAE